MGRVRRRRAERDTWREAVVQYMELYTPDTLACATRIARFRRSNCRRSAPRSASTSRRTRLRSQTYAIVALNLAYDADALAEVAYTDAGGSPILFCVTRTASPTRRRARAGATGSPISPGHAEDAASCSSDAMTEQRVAELGRHSWPGSSSGAWLASRPSIRRRLRARSPWRQPRSLAREPQ